MKKWNVKIEDKKIFLDKFYVYKNGLITDLKGNDVRRKTSDGRNYIYNKKKFFVYWIVAKLYNPNWFKGCIIHHLDNDSSNDDIANLYVCKNQTEHNLFHEKLWRKHLKKATEISHKNKSILKAQKKATELKTKLPKHRYKEFFLTFQMYDLIYLKKHSYAKLGKDYGISADRTKSIILSLKK